MARETQTKVQVTVTMPVLWGVEKQDRQVSVDDDGNVTLRRPGYPAMTFHRDDFTQALRALGRTAEQDRLRKLHDQWGSWGLRPSSAV